jgi:hypothetical protein
MWTDIERNPTERGMRRLRQLAILVVTGKKQLQMFCSIPGLGKTETTLEVFAEHNFEPHYCSPTTPAGYCRDLWKYRHLPYFLDDCDTLARSGPCANIAKMAYGPQRIVVVPTSKDVLRNEEYRQADSDKYDPNTPPPTFKLGPRHGMIWNSNKNFTLPEMVSREMAADFAALISRGLDPLWVPDNPQAVFDRTIWMIVEGRMLRRHRIGARPSEGGFKLEHQQEILEFMCVNGRRLRELTPRMAWQLAMARRHDADWETAWKEKLMPTVQWPALILPEETPLLMSPKMRRATEPVSERPSIETLEPPTAQQDHAPPAEPEPVAVAPGPTHEPAQDVPALPPSEPAPEVELEGSK